LEWSDSGVDGSFRFLKRLWQFCVERAEISELNKAIRKGTAPSIDWDKADQAQQDVRRELYEILRQTIYDFDRLQFNTVVSGCMKILKLLQTIQFNENEINNHLLCEGISILLRLLAPISPHITHHLWQELSYGEDVSTAEWPKVVAEALKSNQVKMIVQVNGKLRGHISVPAEAERSVIENTALAEPNIQRYLQGKKYDKIIVVPNKLVNIVIGEHHA